LFQAVSSQGQCRTLSCLFPPECALALGDNDYPSRQEENKLFVSMMIKYAKQSESDIIYREYPGTHGTFGKDKQKQEDFARFILEKSGIEER
jgi:hypothetical protein